MIEKTARIYVAGHNGLVGSAVVRRLKAAGHTCIIEKSSSELDLREQAAVRAFFETEKPEYVVLAAAKVGGIHANSTYPASFIYDNMMIEANIIDAAYHNKVKKLLFLGSSCIYPKLAPQPIREEYLLAGALEPTNECYALAKIAGIHLCRAYRRQYGFNAISAMPTNLYGPGDNFHPENSHVVPALMRRFHEAKIAGSPDVTIWGPGAPRREFLHVDDLADALYFLLEHYEGEEHVNVGTGEDLTIAALAKLMAEVTGFTGQIRYDASHPDGTPRKLLDVSKLTEMGWKARTPLREGLAETYKWYKEHIPEAHRRHHTENCNVAPGEDSFRTKARPLKTDVEFKDISHAE